MLVLSRKLGQTIIITNQHDGSQIRIEFPKSRHPKYEGTQVGLTAPSHYTILRGELEGTSNEKDDQDESNHGSGSREVQDP